MSETETEGMYVDPADVWTEDDGAGAGDPGDIFDPEMYPEADESETTDPGDLWTEDDGSETTEDGGGILDELGDILDDATEGGDDFSGGLLDSLDGDSSQPGLADFVTDQPDFEPIDPM
jgi:hypothetical protein